MNRRVLNAPDAREIVEPNSEAEWNQARALLQEYLDSLSIEAGFLNIREEVASLPGEYAATRGGFWLARVADDWAGCCALAPLDGTDYANACELRRLYVRPARRQQNLGLMLTERASEPRMPVTTMTCSSPGFDAAVCANTGAAMAARAFPSNGAPMARVVAFWRVRSRRKKRPGWAWMSTDGCLRNNTLPASTCAGVRLRPVPAS